jgi:hypothetical protein
MLLIWVKEDRGRERIQAGLAMRRLQKSPKPREIASQE